MYYFDNELIVIQVKYETIAQVCWYCSVWSLWRARSCRVLKRQKSNMRQRYWSTLLWGLQHTQTRTKKISVFRDRLHELVGAKSEQSARLLISPPLSILGSHISWTYSQADKKRCNERNEREKKQWNRVEHYISIAKEEKEKGELNCF